MRNLKLALLLILVCASQAQQFIQLGDGLKLQSLQELHDLDADNLTCTQDLVQVSESMEAWSEILENQSQLEEDTQSLMELKTAISDYRNQNQAETVLLQIKSPRQKVMAQLQQSTDLTLYQAWRKQGTQLLEGELNLLDSAKDKDDANDCCDRIEKLIDRLLKERQEIKKQCDQPSITINVINSKAVKVKSTSETCQGQGVTVNIKSKKGDDSEAPESSSSESSEEEKKPVDFSQSESSSDEEDDSEDEEIDARKKVADSTQEEPLLEKDDEDEENFQEYGYGFWTRFLVAYPKRMPKGKSEPWYFVSRLTMNKKNQNIEMGDRMLAIWLGKGYYHFTSCDEPKKQNNVIQNINYPDDLDGLWTYIYYSYSVEQKKAVAFIKYGDDELKTATLSVTNPLTKFLKFKIGGNDEKRYPAFQGQFRNIYFSGKKGVFIDSEEKLNGRLQSFKKSVKTFLPRVFTYKLVSNPISREPNTNDIHQVIGANKNPKFPHEYSFSGWFKWVAPTKQEEWHNAFRVQIATPSTDQFLGDRTLSMWVGKGQGGIIHLPTYTYTNLEGEGTPNLIKNIPHKDRHTKWFFVYFGYSKPEQEATAHIKWSADDSDDEEEYDKVKHFTVPRFYVFVGKDKHFPGFSGQIAYAMFNIGEGAYRKGKDFRHKFDIFSFRLGQKRLNGKQPDEKEKEDDDDDDESDGILRPISTDRNNPAVDNKEEDDEEFQFYGYGYWARFLTLFPKRMINGKNAPWYFMSRLTSNPKYENIGMGDRLLAIWQGQGYYHYTTCDKPRNLSNVIQNINTPEDIEGVWTYIYYSYNVKEKKAVGFAKYGDRVPQAILHAVEHPPTKYLRFVLGGKDNNRFPGFNGLISQVHFSTKEAVYIDTIPELNEHIKRTIIPTTDLDKLYRHELVEGILSRKVQDAPDYDEVGGGAQRFPHEYAISGWFKWEQTKQQAWHNVFRVQIGKPSTDRYLGDRTLACWVGKTQGGILHFPTYTYKTMKGQGNANLVQNIQHKNRHFQWSFIYFGYSKNDKKAFVAVRFNNGFDSIEYTGVNHYYAPKYYIFTGRDKQFPGFSGKIAHVNFNLGEGAFRGTPNFKHPNDAFGYAEGEADFYQKPIPKVEPTVDKETGLKHIPNAVNDNKPKVEVDERDQDDLKEYGYGYWARFLTAYPVRLVHGKSAPWYFMSRMTSNARYNNINMGDRILAIWQGDGYYHFTTCDEPRKQNNVVKNINYPIDIEGLWTYIYYSYSVAEKKAVAFIKFGEGDVASIEHAVTHPATKYMKFVLGGKDNNRYPGFNGQFTGVVHSTKPGVYIGTVETFKSFFSRQPSPIVSKIPIKSNKILDSQVNRQTNTPPASSIVDVPFPKEYSISGWFKWEQPKPQRPWHNVFRVQIATPSTDKFLGDRTLSLWVGQNGGGILHCSTYTYKNMKGAGIANTPQNIAHKNRHLQWFYFYQGYSKENKEAYAYVKWTEGEDSLTFKDTNHYFANRYFVFVGKDAQFPGFNGKVAYTAFVTGDGASRKGVDFTHPDDVFRFDKGKINLLPKPDPTQPTVDEKGDIPNEVNNNSPKIDKQLQDSENLVEYGYGYWARFLSAYPVRLISGKNAPWYFVSRLTVNKEYDNIRMGDRTLAIWQGQGFYHFTTCDVSKNQVNVVQNINYPADIEGVWTYIYYSYSVEKKKAVAFITFDKDQPKSITHSVTHPTTNSVRFILGGMDENRYPAFNGVFSKVTYSNKKGAFIDSADALKNLHGLVPITEVKLANTKILAGKTERSEKVAPIHQVVDSKLPSEYAISGWFNWDNLEKQSTWHNIFRVQINTPSTDKFLGDRTLALWLGTPAGGILHFPTYTYTNMNGAGNGNVVQNIVHKDRHQKWFFVYFGYSKDEKNAYAYVKWTDSEDKLIYNNINHYFAPKFYIYLGKDPHFLGFNGKIAYVNFNAGKGSFRKSNNFGDDADNFGFGLGVKELFKPEQPDQLPEPEKAIHESKTSDDNPQVDKSGKSDDELEEYGYGFWLRFLTAYPERLIQGKNLPWYFVSRLTVHQDYDNIRMGDRTLAIWQGQGYYHFTTCNINNNNANVIQNINYPDDIEGVWTYIYYSHSVKESQSVGFTKYGEGDFKQITHKVRHPPTKSIRFIVGGTDEKRYPAFNGLISNVYFNSRQGAYIGSIAEINKFVNQHGGVPSTSLNELVSQPIVKEPVSRQVNDKPIETTVKAQLPHEYAISGWFKWAPIKQQPWHNIFRVQINTPSTDKFLGDRTLSSWLGNGILHFPTYSYVNMNGGGNTNFYKNIEHKERHTKWFFVYFGYSKQTSQAYVYVKWNDSDDNLEYPNANHYYASAFYIYTGKDNHFPGFNGNLGYIQFNAGQGAFKKGKDYSDPKDNFRFQIGFNKFGKQDDEKPKDDKDKPKDEEKPPIVIDDKPAEKITDEKPDEKKPISIPDQVESKVLDNKSSQKEPVFDKTGTSERDLESYGYGYWCRFLTTYPERLLSGKNAPWYFMSRLTKNKDYDNIRMGDRTLAIWQGQGYYHFTTYDTNNPNVIKNIDYPADIEGVWTYIYYSYSNKQAVAFIKYGTQEPKSITHQVTHTATKQVRLIVGGNDEGRYPGFNGQFAQITFRIDNAFAGAEKDLKLGDLPALDPQTLSTIQLIDKQINRTPSDEPSKYAEPKKEFPLEYAISGWFKWKPTAQQPWHNLFRVSIKSPSTDNYLGDRTLTLWLGTPEGGILHFPTYTYTNMNGAGNANYYKNVAHKDRHQDWFFVYYGYSKKAAQTFTYVKWTDGEDSLNYENINHYLVSQFFVYVGRDKHFFGHSGKIAYTSFNMGDGSFTKNVADLKKPYFGLTTGGDQLFKKDDQEIETGKPIKDQLPNAFDQKKPVAEAEGQSGGNLEEYGYGFWARFLTAYPRRLISGKNAPWYFVSRLTQHKEYDNIRMGDRTLAIWQGQGFYHFTTCNQIGANPNVIQNINYPDDIEGVWTYIYYSYSDDKNKAVGFIKYGDDDIKSITHKVTHPDTKFVRFILGGNDEGRYPGFNGVFTQVTFSAQVGVFIDSENALKSILSKQDALPKPFDAVNHQLVETLSRETANNPLQKNIGEEKEMFPEEYALSGWFKWQPTSQAPWHNLFRVQIKTPSTDNTLGDRTLSLWLGTAEGGILHLPTYSYANMNGAGNANYYKNIAHKGEHVKWFFVYFGYSRKERTAYSYAKFASRDDSQTYEKTNHYLAPQFFIFVGRDNHYPGLNGKLAFVNFNSGLGSFRKGKDFKHEKDFFGFGAGTDKLLKPKEEKFTPEEPAKGGDNAFNKIQPVLDKEANSASPFEEYGYGYWARFLTVYPERLISGKNEAWYFMSRLTVNKDYDNIRMGDRTLAIWQGQGFYHFTTCNAATNNPNQIQNINYPADIEGVWTYIYYSYSAEESKAVGFIKYGDDKLKAITHETSHPLTKYLRFILGGKDQNRYWGFNGQFAQVTFSTKDGAFVDKESLLESYLAKNGHPVDAVQLHNELIVKDKISRTAQDAPIEKSVSEPKFPLEYAFSGWFKWVHSAQQPWHNIFRVSIKQPSTDQFLGDRTLTSWIGTGEGGILHFPTYTYTNMNGAGNANYYKNIAHKNRHQKWFFIYFGYSRAQKETYTYVKWTNDEDSMSYPNINHYLTPEFFIYVGRDKHFPGFNGQIGLVNFNSGSGAFKKGNNFKDDKNTFGFDAPFTKTKVTPFDNKERSDKVLPSGFEQKVPSLERTFAGEDVEDIDEYGYGFWCRFLTKYPEQLMKGVTVDWLFMARLTKNQQLSDIGVGDRTLALWQGRGYFHFTTYTGNNANAINNINFDGDMEGQWIYIHHSHSLERKQSVAFVKFSDTNKIFKNVQQAVHVPPTYLKFYLGGQNLQYKGYNGQFASAFASVNKGIFVDEEKEFVKLIENVKAPVKFNLQLKNKIVVEKDLVFTDKFEIKENVYDDMPLVGEYAWSGWFKWTPCQQAVWHLGVRLSINQNSDNMSFLGDRTLNMWVGTGLGGILHFATYDYTNIFGAGNVNSVQNILYKNDLPRWHFIYFGYSKPERKAFSAVEFRSRTETLTYKDHDHYLPNKFSLYLGKDKWHATYSGQISYFRFNGGAGAFKTDGFDKAVDDIFGYGSGKGTLIKPPQKFNPEKRSEKVSDSPFNQKESVYQRKLTESELDDIEEYGYGFWCRFLTHYPQQMIRGLQVPWSFMARLTKNEKLQDITVGDRTLALWLGRGYYHFTSYNGGNPNQIHNINHPVDIEGVWTFIYHAHSLDSDENVIYIKFGNDKLQQVVQKIVHTLPTYLEFYLGGNNMNYPAFNGQFSDVFVSTGKGIFTKELGDIEALLKTIKTPDTYNTKLTTKKIIDKAQEFKPEQNTKDQVYNDSPLVGEYAWSGWFKWTPCQQAAWHLIVRLAINGASENLTFLGDRTLSAWVGRGFFHFTTYTYANIYGAGTVNTVQNINYEDDHVRWHFIYYGYSRDQRSAHARVVFNDRVEQVTFDKINHFLPKLFNLYYAKDKWHSTYSGQIAFLNFNAGSGAFNKDQHDKPEGDIFGFNAGKLEFPPEKLPPVDDLRKQEVLDSEFDGKELFNQEFKDLKDVEEYGYGFYIRYMQEYPKQLQFGKSAPWYIVGRMTNNEKYGNIAMGDRLLAMWQGRNIFIFVTCDYNSKNPNIVHQLPQGDIDGVWTFVYFSYSLIEQKAVGIMKYENNPEVFHKVQEKLNHGKQNYLRVIFGGKDQWYPGFNGQYANYNIKIGKTAFVDHYDQMKRYLNNRIPTPDSDKLTLKQIKHLKEEKTFVGTKQNDEVLTLDEESRFQREYSVGAWLKWNPTNLPPWYTVFRLSQWSPQDTIHGRLLYNDFTVYKHNVEYRLHSYSYTDMLGNGNPWTAAQFFNPNFNQWHFVYMAYSKDKHELYHYIRYIDEESDKLLPKINHFLLGKHYFTFGRDFNKLFGYYRGFTGIANLVTLSYGPGAFRMKPLGKNKDQDDLFSYDLGAKIYYPKHDLKTIPAGKQDGIIPVGSSDKDPVITVELENNKDDQKINGLNEYGWTLWTRWMRTTPEVLPFRKTWHSMGRLTMNRNHQDFSKEGDRGLAVWVGWGFYYFSACYIGGKEKVERINYKKMEGEWVFISFTYKENKGAKGVVYYAEQDKVDEIDLQVKQRLIDDYMQFLFGRKWYDGFNGHFAKPTIRLGEGAYLTKQDAKELADGQLKLGKEFYFNQERKTIPLQKLKEIYQKDQKGEAITLKPDDILGKEEYAISGWFKWKDIGGVPNAVLFRVTSMEEKNIGNARSPGDQVFATFIYPNKVYHITTYTIDELNGGNWNVHKNINFEPSQDNAWNYIYEGYSKKKQQLFAYIKFPNEEKTLIHQNINHFTPSFFTVLLHKDPHYYGWNGWREAFYFNVGTGAYKEKNFGDAENEVFTFGFGGHLMSKPKNWENNDLIESNIGEDQKVAVDHVIKDDSIDGLIEYGYGMWTRFVWNGKTKLINKPQWVGMARLSLIEKDDNLPLGQHSLSSWVGATYYHFVTNNRKTTNYFQNLEFETMLDGQWNYIYFSHKLNRAIAFVAFNGELIRNVQFTDVAHPPVSEFLALYIGNQGTSAGVIKRFPNFNGHFTKVSLNLGDGAYIDNADTLRKRIPSMPKFPELKQISKVVIEDQVEMERKDVQVKPYEFGEEQFEFNGAVEYSVSLWFKWQPLARAPWEAIYTLTYNEPKLRQNHVKPGDRQLSMFQYQNHHIFFSSYTTPQNHNNFAAIYSEFPVPPADQNSWVYGYYAYSRQESSLFSYLKTKSKTDEKKLVAMHRVPRYFGLYVGKDGIHTPYNGRFQQVYLMAGSGAYRTKDILSFEPYVAGAGGIVLKPYAWNERQKLFEQDQDKSFEVELAKEKVDNHQTYGYGFWARYLTAIPTRTLSKPNRLALTRLTTNKDHTDFQKPGDQTLVIRVGEGSYLFNTYDENKPNVVKNIEYGQYLEGVWNFLYFSYSSDKQQATAFVKLPNDIKRETFPDTQHVAINGYAKFIIGKEFTYKSFQGQIAQLQVLFGNAAYVHDTDGLQKAIKTLFSEPELNEPGAVILKIQENEKEKALKDEPQVTEWPDQYQYSLEYSVFGWFRYSQATLQSANTVLLRLTNNEPPYRKTFETIGDRTLTVLLQQNNYVFATYDLGTVDNGRQPNILKTIPYENNLGLWTYVYFGYNWHTKTAAGIINFPKDNNKYVIYEKVSHMVPKYLALFAGSDGQHGGWVGPMTDVGAIFGKGAFVDPRKGNYLNLLPNVVPPKQKSIDFGMDDDALLKVPKDPKAPIDQEFKEGVNGLSEYGYGLWTRWLMDIPQRVWEKSPYHHLVRLTSTQKYEDLQALGNRVLANWVGKGAYHFATYDKLTNKPNVYTNAKYDDYLEGHWNYIYFSYSSGKAVGFVFFGDLESGPVSRVEISGIDHLPLNGYARVVVANNEFGYQPFNGMIKGFKLHLGSGFVQTKDDFLKNIIGNNPKPIVKVPLRTDISIMKDEWKLSKGNDKSYIQQKYDQYSGVLEYAVSGWVQTQKGLDGAVVFRLTINEPEKMKDSTNAGDRTLACFYEKNSFVFASYDYGDLDTNEDDRNDVNTQLQTKESENLWAFVYFGYNLKTRVAFSYVLYPSREDSYKFTELKQFVPNNFWFYLGKDGIKAPFEGSMFDFNLYFGDGSFTMKPKELIKRMPYEPDQGDMDQVKSALLGNQGLSSVKLIKNQPNSGQLDAGSGPISGQLDKDQGPQSGQSEKAGGPVSGQIDKAEGPQSGQSEKAGGPVSGQVDKSQGPQSGQQDKSQGPQSGQQDKSQGPASGQSDKSSGPASGQSDKASGPASGQSDKASGPESGQSNKASGPESGQQSEGQKPQSGEQKS